MFNALNVLLFDEINLVNNRNPLIIDRVIQAPRMAKNKTSIGTDLNGPSNAGVISMAMSGMSPNKNTPGIKAIDA